MLVSLFLFSCQHTSALSESSNAAVPTLGLVCCQHCVSKPFSSPLHASPFFFFFILSSIHHWYKGMWVLHTYVHACVSNCSELMQEHGIISWGGTTCFIFLVYNLHSWKSSIAFQALLSSAFGKLSLKKNSVGCPICQQMKEKEKNVEKKPMPFIIRT